MAASKRPRTRGNPVAAQVAVKPDGKTCEEFIADNQGLIISTASRWNGSIPRQLHGLVDREELILCAREGAREAYRTFDPQKEAKPTTWAVEKMNRAIQAYLHTLKTALGDSHLSMDMRADDQENADTVGEQIAGREDVEASFSRRIEVEEAQRAVERLQEAIEEALNPLEAEILRLRWGLDLAPDVFEFQGIEGTEGTELQNPLPRKAVIDILYSRGNTRFKRGEDVYLTDEIRLIECAARARVRDYWNSPAFANN